MPNPIVAAITNVVAPISKIFTKREERKINKDTIKGKIQQARQGDATAITLTDAEWETVSTGLQDSTWKDEYVTVSVVSIFNLFIIGGISAAFGHPEILEGTTLGIQALVAAGVDLGMILTAVVFAAIGLKLWRA